MSNNQWESFLNHPSNQRLKEVMIKSIVINPDDCPKDIGPYWWLK